MENKSTQPEIIVTFVTLLPGPGPGSHSRPPLRLGRSSVPVIRQVSAYRHRVTQSGSLAENLADTFQSLPRICVWRGACSYHSGGVRNPMMKIQMKELDDQLILQVEGRLAGAFVPELENCWQVALVNQPKRKISVDLKSVTCIDRAGRCLLQSMHSQGVGFLRAGLAVQDILEQIMEQAECRH